VRAARALGSLCAVVAALCVVSLAALPAAHADGKKPGIVRVPAPQGFGRAGPALGQPLRSGPFTAKHLHKPDGRPGFVKRRKHRRRPFYAPTGYYYAPANPYVTQPVVTPSYPSQSSESAAAYKPPPVTPKWVHVGDDIGFSGSAEGGADGGGLGRNCLSVKTQITVDGAPVDAFGEACLLADGSWELKPSKQTD